MEVREKLRTHKCKRITNDWNDDAYYTHTSLPVSDLILFHDDLNIQQPPMKSVFINEPIMICGN
jgi:hypothetical protein